MRIIMARKLYKRDFSRFLMLHHWIYECPAWQSLKPGPRALYWELKHKFNGYNNGEIYLSQRDAGNALNIGRDTVGIYFTELEEKGFINKTMGHCLGPAGKGQAAKWELTEYPMPGERKGKMSFMSWKK
jgi:hypothetical protein